MVKGVESAGHCGFIYVTNDFVYGSRLKKGLLILHV